MAVQTGQKEVPQITSDEEQKQMKPYKKTHLMQTKQIQSLSLDNRNFQINALQHNGLIQ